MITRYNSIEQLTVWWTETDWYPFIEDENGCITGPGHQNYSEFAMAVIRYYGDLIDDGDLDWDESIVDAIEHKWIAPFSDDEGRFELVSDEYPGAIPVTTIWNLW